MPLPTEISTTLLLPRPARFDMGQIHAALEARMSTNCPPFERLDWHQTQLLSSPDLHLQLRARDLPLLDDRFDSALSSELAGMMHDDLSVAVARHRASVTLRVGTGPRPQPRGQAFPPPSHAIYECMLILAHTAATQLAQGCHPLAVHWAQSDQLLSPGRFSAMGNMLFPLPLFLHPRPSCREKAGEEWISLDVEGAQHLLDRTLSTEYAPVSLPWMMQRVYAFVAHLRATGLAVSDGMEFATAEGERFRVRIDERGAIRLRLEELHGKPISPPEMDTQDFAA
ncbi:hypothetical protein [Aliiruegeria sabulilitoris]|uniref:hypothetical protein n=1 Tax=Aliiruegeria sabulilitoris TaxID=1510458 RepID=UPI000836919A|nr:hypothetical protein [Aliiruegeria sabulilitoris]NDR57187.1 hypothetical protein [Pseudoruegeria sp. M32A2M]